MVTSPRSSPRSPARFVQGHAPGSPWWPVRTGVLVLGGSGSVSPDEPLTVQRTQRRGPRPRRVVVSDSEGDEAPDGPTHGSSSLQLRAPVSVSRDSQGRQEPARLHVAPPLLDVTNQSVAPSKALYSQAAILPGGCGTSPASLPFPCKSGILELAALLGGGDRGLSDGAEHAPVVSNVAPSDQARSLQHSGSIWALAAPETTRANDGVGSGEATAAASPSATLRNAEPQQWASVSSRVEPAPARSSPIAGSDADEDAPLAFTRSVHIPRSRRRILHDDGSDSPAAMPCGVAFGHPPSTAPAGGSTVMAAANSAEQPYAALREAVVPPPAAGVLGVGGKVAPPASSAGQADLAESPGCDSPAGNDGPTAFGTPASRSATEDSDLSFHSPSNIRGADVDEEQLPLKRGSSPEPLAAPTWPSSPAARTSTCGIGEGPVGGTAAEVSFAYEAGRDAVAGTAVEDGPASGVFAGPVAAEGSSIGEPGGAGREQRAVEVAAGLPEDAAVPGAAQLAQVPRRRQRQPGRDAASQAAAAGLGLSDLLGRSGGGVGFNQHASAADSDGLMYDLYGELLLVSQLRGLSLSCAVDKSAAAGQLEESAEVSAISSPCASNGEQAGPSGRSRSASPAGRGEQVLSGAGGSTNSAAGQREAEAMDLTLLSSDEGSTGGDAGGDGASSDSDEGRPWRGRMPLPSPAELLGAHRKDHSSVGDEGCAGAGFSSPTSRGVLSRPWNTPTPDEDEGTAVCWRPGNGTVVGRRRAVILDSSPDSPPPTAGRDALPASTPWSAQADDSLGGSTPGPKRRGAAAPGDLPAQDPYALPSTPSSGDASGGGRPGGAAATPLATPLQRQLRAPGLTDTTAASDDEGYRMPLETMSLPQLLQPRASEAGGAMSTARKRGGGGRGKGGGRATGRQPGAAGGAAAGGVDAGGQAAKTARAIQKAFIADRERLAKELYDKWNDAIFGGRLPRDLPLVWNSRLASTAGQVVAERELKGVTRRVAAKLELSPKIIDSPDRLRNTLAHEMCHVAAWHISHEYNRPHGPAWESWCRRFEQLEPGLSISRTHDYIVSYPHRWRCTRPECAKEYGRQRQTIQVGRHVCAACHAPLTYLGRFDKAGRLVEAPAGEDEGAGGADGLAPTTGKKKLSTYTKFMQENFTALKERMPAKTPNTVIFKAVAEMWRAVKPVDEAARPAAPSSPAGAGAHAPYLQGTTAGGSSGRRRSRDSGFAGRTVRRLSHDSDGLVPRMCDLSLAADSD